MKTVWMMVCVLLAFGCAETDTTDPVSTSGGESGPLADYEGEGDAEAEEEAADGEEANAPDECEEGSTDFFCVDAGTFEGGDDESDEEGEAEGGDEKGGDEKGGEGITEEAMAQCIEDCVGKGESEEDCGPLCEAYLSGELGGEKGGEGDEKGGEGDEKGGEGISEEDLAQCVEDCVLKGDTEENCIPICEAYLSGLASGGGDEKGGEGDEKGGEGDEKGGEGDDAGDEKGDEGAEGEDKPGFDEGEAEGGDDEKDDEEDDEEDEDEEDEENEEDK